MLPSQYPHACVLAVVTTPSLTATAPMSDMMPALRELTAEGPLIFYGVSRAMRGPPCHFQLKEGAVPSAVYESSSIVLPLMPKLKQELDSHENQGFISKMSKPTLSWSLQKDIAESTYTSSLNHCTIQPTFDYTTPFQAVRTIPTGMKFFTLIDALKSYHQVELNEESSAMTKFFTPFCRYNSYRKFFLILSTKYYNRQFCSGMADINKRSGNIKQIKS